VASHTRGDVPCTQESQSCNPISQFTPQSQSSIRPGTTRKENRMGMTESQDRLARAREEIAIRVANFKATQEKFQREREEYFVTTLKNAKHSEHSRPTLESAPF
jgi:hypothetical protein